MRWIVALSLLFAISVAHAGESAPQDQGSQKLDVKMMIERMEAIEKSLEAVVLNLNGKPVVVDESAVQNAKAAPLTQDAQDNELLKQKIQALDRSLANVARAIDNKKGRIGENCYFIKICTYVACVKYGPDGRCLEQACRAWEWRWKCD